MLPAGFKTDFDGLAEALEGEPTVSVRFNKAKVDSVPDGEPVPWCDRGRYLAERVPFTFDPALHQGKYYVQDASSMVYDYIISHVVDQSRPVRYLDACAAPGGKTTAAIDALPEGSLVVANEYVPLRAEILRENLVKWGYEGIMVSKGDTRKFRKLNGEFDVIAADVPCSGEGMFRKDPEAVAQWSPSLVAECASRQKEIVDNLWGALRGGGIFIYSTCTFNREENEDMVRWILSEYDAEIVELPFPADWGIVYRDGCHHFLPGRVKGEGLTVAVIRKGGCAAAGGKISGAVKQGAVSSECKSRILNPEKYRWMVEGDRIVAFPLAHDVARIEKTLDVIHRGIEVGHIKGKDILPAQSLAMSRGLNRDAFAVSEVGYDTAIAYLRREAVTIEDAPVGYVLLTYKGTPLGFVKNLGRRANNLYPQPWRILSSRLPQNPVSIV